MTWDKRTTTDIHNENAEGLACMLFGAALLIVAAGLIIAAMIWL